MALATDAGPPGRDESYGYGRLNIVKALTADVTPLPSATGTQATGAAPAPVDTSAIDTSDLPKSSNMFAYLVVGVLFVIGIVFILVVVRRRGSAR